MKGPTAFHDLSARLFPLWIVAYRPEGRRVFHVKVPGPCAVEIPPLAAEPYGATLVGIRYADRTEVWARIGTGELPWFVELAGIVVEQ